MPKMDGFQLYTKNREKDPKVKICFLTASEMFYETFRESRSELGKAIVVKTTLFKSQSKRRPN